MKECEELEKTKKKLEEERDMLLSCADSPLDCEYYFESAHVKDRQIIEMDRQIQCYKENKRNGSYKKSMYEKIINFLF